jgi:hypothetical protein
MECFSANSRETVNTGTVTVENRSPVGFAALRLKQGFCGSVREADKRLIR